VKRILLILTLLIVTSVNFAQSDASATVDATVLANLTITKDTDINFGSISGTSTPILDPKDISHTDVGTQYTVGVFSAGGSDGTQITVSYPATVVLGDGVASTITFTPNLFGHVDTQNSAVAVTANSQVSLGATGYKFWLGGNLGNLSGQTVGTYASDESNGDGNFTLTVEYY